MSVTILVSFYVRKGCPDGTLLKEVDTTVSHVKVVGGGDGRIEVAVFLPFVHPCDESLVISVELNGRERGCLG